MQKRDRNVGKVCVASLILLLMPLILRPPPASSQELSPLSPRRELTVGMVSPAADEILGAPLVKPVSSASTGSTLVALAVTTEGIDLIVNGSVAEYTAYSMAKPDRYVVDLPGVRLGVGRDKVSLNAFGMVDARLVQLEGRCRIIFEGGGEGVRVKVVRTDRGLQLQPDTRDENRKAAVPVATLTEPDNSLSKVESLDFGIVDTGSRLTLRVGGACVATQPLKSSEGVSFHIKNCSLPRSLRRTLESGAFPSAVRSIIPTELSVKGVPETKLLVKLKRAATWSLRQNEGTVVLDIIHPKLREQATTVVATSQPLPVSSPTMTTKFEELAPIQAGGKKVYTGRKITLEFVDADIRKIFQLIAEVSNLNILLGDDVAGNITIKLVNVPWDQALEMILESKGLAMRSEGNIVLVKPRSKFKSADEEALDAKKSREKMMELQTRVFDVNFAQSGDVVTQFKSLGSGRSDSSITQDERTNKVIVTDIEPAVNRMRGFLESIDIPEKQVLIEARLVEASDSFSRDLGIQWGIHYRDPSASIMGINSLSTGFGGAVTAPPTSGTYGAGMATGISFGTLGSNINVDLRLSAAATADLVKIISTPKIATLNNKAAKITQGQSIPYQNTTANTGAVTQFVEAALSLEVTPHITPDGSVMMKIKASNNSPGSVPPGGTAPAINKKEATTELIVRSGETTVIGGIYIDNDTENNSGVPFLMDIPFIGWLFKSNTKSKLKTELLIFITPRILS